MENSLSQMVGAEYPVFGFSHCRDVVIAISKAGGVGILGTARYTDESALERDLTIIDREVAGQPYGVDTLMPKDSESQVHSPAEGDEIPGEHRRFINTALRDFGVGEIDGSSYLSAAESKVKRAKMGPRQAELALRHKVSLLVSGLGTPPPEIVELAHQSGVRVGALAGRVKHAEKHATAGLDFIVAQGFEAGGHTGDVTTMVLVPDIVDAVAPIPVLAAGGIGTGRQITAALALGADGVWLGSIWLAAAENDASPGELEAYFSAAATDTVKSNIFTGKPVRMLKNAWTEYWEDPSAPEPLGFGMQQALVTPAHSKLRALNDPQRNGALPVGQVVGRMRAVRSCRDIVYDLVMEHIETLERLSLYRGQGTV